MRSRALIVASYFVGSLGSVVCSAQQTVVVPREIVLAGAFFRPHLQAVWIWRPALWS